MAKRITKYIIFILLSLLIYETAGALLPFVRTKEAGAEFVESFQPEAFYGGSKDSVDRAAVVETSMDALNSRIEMIHQAQKRIVLSTFDIREGESCMDIFSSILEAAGRGVSVQVLVDGLYGSVHMNGVPVFYALAAHPNIEFRFYNIPSLVKPWTINGRMHDKYIIIDDKLLLLGGRNTFDYFLGEYHLENLSYDRDVLVYNTAFRNPEQYSSSVISQMDDYFQKMWDSPYCKTVFEKPSAKIKKQLPAAKKRLEEHYQALAAGRPALVRRDIDYLPRTVAVKKATLIYNPTHIYAKEPWVWHQVQYLISHAGQNARIHTPYAVFSKDMYRGLAKAVSSVPRVTMMLNATSVGDNFMASSDYTLNRNKILDTGVELYEYFGEHSTHGKTVTIDGELSLIGSYNLDMRSTYVDTEVMLVIHGEEFSRRLEEHLDHLEERALKVLPDESYEEKPGVPVIPVSPVKKRIFAVTSRLFQLFRYLI